MPLFFLDSWSLLVFLIQILFLFGANVAYLSKNKRLDFVLFLMLSFFLCYFYSIRNASLPDTQMYISVFRNLQYTNVFPWGEGFHLLMKSISLFSSSESGYLIGSSIFFVALLSLNIFLYCKKEYKTFILLFCFSSISILDLSINVYRQGVAVLVLMIGIHIYIKNSKLLGLLVIALSLFFHWGAMLIVLIFLFSQFLASKPKLIYALSIITTSLLLVSYFINFDFINMLIGKMSFISSLGGGIGNVDINSKFGAYLGGDVEGALFYDGNIFRRIYSSLELIYFSVISFFFMWFFRKKNIVPSVSFYQLYTLQLGIVLYSTLLISMVWFIRNFYWCALLNPIVLYEAIASYDSTVKRRYIVSLCYSIFILLYLSLWFWRHPLVIGSY